MHLFTAHFPDILVIHLHPHTHIHLLMSVSVCTDMRSNGVVTSKTEQTGITSLGSRICAGVKRDTRLHSSFVIGGMVSPLNCR